MLSRNSYWVETHCRKKSRKETVRKTFSPIFQLFPIANYFPLSTTVSLQKIPRFPVHLIEIQSRKKSLGFAKFYKLPRLGDCATPEPSSTPLPRPKEHPPHCPDIFTITFARLRNKTVARKRKKFASFQKQITLHIYVWREQRFAEYFATFSPLRAFNSEFFQAL